MIKLAHPVVEADEQAAVIEVLNSGQLAQGPRVAAFEAAFARYQDAPHAVALNSGTAALDVALLARGIGPGDEVIVPAFSFAATANTVLHAGATPVFVDVRASDFGIDATCVEAAITPRTRAVVPVHLYGQICDVEPVAALCAARGIALIEDAAQAVGAELRGRRAGAWGDASFSFYATKNLQTGEGGMIVTRDAAVDARARVLRSQGEPERYVTEEAGFNYRMTEVAAAIGGTQLPKLDARIERRQANAARLTELLADVAALTLPRELPGRRHVWHQYTVRVAGGREALRAGLRERGIETGVFYPTPIHRQPLYRRLGYGNLELPVATRLADEVLSLPVHPALSDADVETVAAAVRELVGR